MREIEEREEREEREEGELPVAPRTNTLVDMMIRKN